MMYKNRLAIRVCGGDWDAPAENDLHVRIVTSATLKGNPNHDVTSGRSFRRRRGAALYHRVSCVKDPFSH